VAGCVLIARLVGVTGKRADAGFLENGVFGNFDGLDFHYYSRSALV
jgi:hypothetical protein